MDLPDPVDLVDPLALLLLLLLDPPLLPEFADPLDEDDFDPPPLYEDALGPEDVFEEPLSDGPPEEDDLAGPEELPPDSDFEIGEEVGALGPVLLELDPGAEGADVNVLVDTSLDTFATEAYDLAGPAEVVGAAADGGGALAF